MASNAKPVIVFIPGAWHTPEGFEPLITQLAVAGYSSVSLSLPSNGAHPGHADFSADVTKIRNTVRTLVDGGKDVVVVMHSGGSVAGSEALKGVQDGSAGASGKRGKVVRLVYIGILLPKQGTTMFETFMSVVQSPDLDPTFEYDPQSTAHVVAEDGTSTFTDGVSRFYNDLPEEEAKYWASRLTSVSLGALGSTLTYAAWHHIPTAYILPTQDHTIPLRQVRQIVKREGIETVLEIEGSHCVYLSHVEEVAGFIRKAAGETL